MTMDMLFALATYAFVTTITPGPNNTMLLASGANFGFVRTLPHLAGVSLGFALMVAVMGLGLAAALVAWPALHEVLRWVGVVWMLRLAWLLARAGPIGEADRAGARPMRFHEAVAFQWVNPKAWVMAIGAVAAYGGGDGRLAATMVIPLVFILVGAPCIATWAALGAGLRRVLADPRRLAIFNFAMALALVASIVPIVFDGR